MSECFHIEEPTSDAPELLPDAFSRIGLAIIPELYLHSPYLVSGNSASELRKYVTLLPFTSPGNTIAIGYNTDRYLSSFAQAFIDLALRKFEYFR